MSSHREEGPWTITVRPVGEPELDGVAAFVARLQHDPTHHIGYLDMEVGPLVVQLRELQPLGVDGVLGAFRDGALVGVLAADWEPDPPRVWWHGPLVSDDDWRQVADRLYASASELLPPEVVEQELFLDGRNERAAAFAERHGFRLEPGSAVLSRSLTPPPAAAPPIGVAIRRVASGDRAELAALHDELFPSTHLPGRRLDDEPGRFVSVAEREAHVVGYVVAERQESGDGYLDFLGVAPTDRGFGLGRALVAAAAERLVAAGCTRVHLTVRDDNAAARHLYVALGFEHERVAVPWRRGRTRTT